MSRLDMKTAGQQPEQFPQGTPPPEKPEKPGMMDQNRPGGAPEELPPDPSASRDELPLKTVRPQSRGYDRRMILVPAASGTHVQVVYECPADARPYTAEAVDLKVTDPDSSGSVCSNVALFIMRAAPLSATDSVGPSGSNHEAVCTLTGYPGTVDQHCLIGIETGPLVIQPGYQLVAAYTVDATGLKFDAGVYGIVRELEGS